MRGSGVLLAADPGRSGEYTTMLPELFATKPLPLRDQGEAWRAWNLPLLDVTPSTATSDGFDAENRVWTLDDGVLVTQITAPPARAVRSPRLIRHLPVDHWVVT